MKQQRTAKNHQHYQEIDQKKEARKQTRKQLRCKTKYIHKHGMLAPETM